VPPPTMSTELGAANATTNTSSPSVTPAALQVINEQVAQQPILKAVCSWRMSAD